MLVFLVLKTAYSCGETTLKEAKREVERYRELAKEDPDRYMPKLAKALERLGRGYSDLGHYGEALKYTREAVRPLKSTGNSLGRTLTGTYRSWLRPPFWRSIFSSAPRKGITAAGPKSFWRRWIVC